MRTVAVPILAVVLVACTGSPPAPPPAILPYSIDASGSEHSSLDADTSGERAGRGAARGAGVGAGTGALVSLLCGPYVLPCLGLFAGGGAVAGAVGGSIYGVTGLSKHDAERVEAALKPLDERRDFTGEIVESLRSRVPEGLHAAPGSAAIRVKVELQRIELTQHAGDKLELTLRAGMSVGRSSRHGQKTYRYHQSTGSRPLEAWLANDGAMFDAGLTYCVQKTVQNMADELGL